MDTRVRFSKPQLSEIKDFLVFNRSRFMSVARKILKFCPLCHLKCLYLTVLSQKVILIAVLQGALCLGWIFEI